MVSRFRHFFLWSMELVENVLLVFGKENVQSIGDLVRNHRIEHSTSHTINKMRGILRIFRS